MIAVAAVAGLAIALMLTGRLGTGPSLASAYRSLPAFAASAARPGSGS